MRLPHARAPCLKPPPKFFCTRVRKHPMTSESRRFESSFPGLSRVNDSLKRIILCPTENHAREYAERRVRNRNAGGIASGVWRFGVTDDALDARVIAPQRALDRVDILMHLDDAHRGHRAAMEVDDLAGRGVAHPHTMNVADLGLRRIARQRLRNLGNPARGGIAAERQLRLQRLDMGVDLDIGTEFLADLLLQAVGDGM